MKNWKDSSKKNYRVIVLIMIKFDDQKLVTLIGVQEIND